MVRALEAARGILDATPAPGAASAGGFVFDYDPETLAELEQAAVGRPR